MNPSNTDNREQTFDEKLDAILANFFNNVEKDVHSDNFNNGSVITKAGTEAKQAIKTLMRDYYYSRNFIKYSVGEEIGLYRITDRIARVGKNTKYRVVCIGCGAPMFRYSNKFKLPHKECPQYQIINPQKEGE